MIEPKLTEQSLWVLESAAANVYPLHRTCFVIKTSICKVKQELQENSNITKSITDQYAFEQVAYSIKESSIAHPKFLEAINSGRVRMNVLDYEHYDLKSCDNFEGISKLFLNHDFWGNKEYLEQDSDFILNLQNDGIICRPFYVDNWREFAYVGAPWPPKTYLRNEMPDSWSRFHDGNVANISFPLFPTEDEIRTKHEFGPVGNGGISMRSRQWMRKATRYCPTIYSGLSEDERKVAPCKGNLDNGFLEDMFFATILRGMGAPLPTLFEASLFGTELRTPNEFLDVYRNIDNGTQEEFTAKRWYSPYTEIGPVELYREMQESNMFTVSLTFHKPWIFRHGVWETPHTRKYCPYFQYILPEKEKNYTTFSK
ncbi:predicted protein [Chaetoceros tenuissimus]|nr:predicted protein [Chaetoceros tenuissimus]